MKCLINSFNKKTNFVSFEFIWSNFRNEGWGKSIFLKNSLRFYKFSYCLDLEFMLKSQSDYRLWDWKWKEGNKNFRFFFFVFEKIKRRRKKIKQKKLFSPKKEVFFWIWNPFQSEVCSFFCGWIMICLDGNQNSNQKWKISFILLLLLLRKFFFILIFP